LSQISILLINFLRPAGLQFYFALALAGELIIDNFLGMILKISIDEITGSFHHILYKQSIPIVLCKGSPSISIPILYWFLFLLGCPFSIAVIHIDIVLLGSAHWLQVRIDYPQLLCVILWFGLFFIYSIWDEFGLLGFCKYVDWLNLLLLILLLLYFLWWLPLIWFPRTLCHLSVAPWFVWVFRFEYIFIFLRFPFLLLLCTFVLHILNY